ncbi:hypothetical protein GS504_00945 [Rhodococcus hoagii]|nr:hypothetical protein [Prescottella equi]NKS72191.1 hypothetical protein [Prescottella equi]
MPTQSAASPADVDYSPFRTPIDMVGIGQMLMLHAHGRAARLHEQPRPAVVFAHDTAREQTAQLTLSQDPWRPYDPDHDTMLIAGELNCGDLRPSSVSVRAMVDDAVYARDVLAQILTTMRSDPRLTSQDGAYDTARTFMELLTRRIDGQSWEVATPAGEVVARYLTQAAAEWGIDNAEASDSAIDTYGYDEGAIDEDEFVIRLAPPNHVLDETIPVRGAEWTEARFLDS